MENENVKKATSGSKVVILTVVAAIVVALVAAVVLYFTVFTSPVRIYKNIVADAIDNMFIDGTLEKQSVDMELDVSLDLEDEELEENPLVELIDAIDLAFNVQLDNKTKETVIHMNSTYDKEKLANLSMFLDYEKAKSYIYAKDYYDKYLEIDLDDQLGEIDLQQSQNLKIDSKDDAKKIIKEELKNIITDEICSKEDGSYVLKTTTAELAKNISKALESLKSNEDFLDCFEKTETVKELLESYIYIMDEMELDEQKIKVTLEVDLLLNVEKATVELAEMAEIMIKNDGEKTTFEVKVLNKTVMNGELLETKESVEFKVALALDEVGEITVKVKVKENEIKELDKINEKKVQKLENLTEDQIEEICEKLEDSKLAEIIEKIEEAYESPIDKAEQAIIAADVSAINDKLNLAYVELRMENISVINFNDSTVFTVKGKKYVGLKSYYKDVVPEIDEYSFEYLVPEGYEVKYYSNGTAMVVEMNTNDQMQSVIDATELKQVVSIAQLTWAKAYVDGIRDEASLKNEVINELNKNNIDVNKYNIVVSATGVTVTKK